MEQRRRRTSRIVLAVAVVLAVIVGVFGLPPSIALSEAELGDYRTLLNATEFAGPSVGFAGVTPEVVAALRRLERSENGSTAFKYAVLQGTTAAKLYGLVGLKRRSPVTFAVFVQPFRVWPGDVPTFFGCIMSAEKTRHIVTAPDGTGVRLQKGETLDDWWSRNRRSGEVQLDIIGGGYTAMFFDPPEKGNAA